ncbi:MAG TPA: glycosyltransferase, partial [Phycisphaerales bacterium]|nr:glycosyltransferase [Phycisphaerales bacterium]
MLDVMIITHNESLNIPHCLDALKGWANRIFVIDSGSTDGTQELARERGAEVIHHEWEGYARQKNWGLENLPFESPWILIVDADEIITPKLRQELEKIVSVPVDQIKESGFYINRLTYFLGKPIRHCGFFPSWNLRLLRPGKGRYEDREVHEHIIVDGPTGYIDEPMLHNDRRGLEHYMAKHNRYSTLEARSILQELRNPNTEAAAHLTGQTRRRRWLKRYVMPWVPFPGTFRFLYMYIFRLGILDGGAGLEFCKFISMYDALVALKFRDLKRQADEDGSILMTDKTVRKALAVPEGEDSVAKAEPGSTVVTVPTVPSEPASMNRVAPTVEPKIADAVPAAPTAPVPAVTIIGPPKAMPRHPDADRYVAIAQPDRLPSGKWPAIGTVPVSVLIPVKNERLNVVECIRHVLWANEVVIIDSQSTDTTVPLSQAMGAQVYQFHYSPEGWPKKKNWALEN